MPKNIIKSPSKAAKKAKSKRSPARRSSGPKVSRKDEILATIKQAHDIGYTHPSTKLLKFIANTTIKDSSFSNILSSLKGEGLIMYHGKKRVILSPKGAEVVGVPSPPQSNDQAQARIKEILKPKQIQIFDALAKRGTHLYEYRELCKKVCSTDQNTKNFGNLISKMKATLEIVEYEVRTDATGSEEKYLRLARLAFPFPVTGAAAATSPDGVSMDSAIPIDE